MLLLRGYRFQDADITSTLKILKVALVKGDTREVECIVRIFGMPA